MWPVFLTSLTTAIGFLSLNFADMPPFRVMGNMVAFGALCAFVYSVTLLPAFLSIVPMRSPPARKGRTEFFRSPRAVRRLLAHDASVVLRYLDRGAHRRNFAHRARGELAGAS